MKNRRFVIGIILTAIFLLSYYIVFTIIRLNTEQRINLTLESKIKNLETHYNVILHNQKITAYAIYQATISIPGIIDILSIANSTDDEKILAPLRKRLYSLIEAKYENIKLQGVLQYHFVTSQNTSFLRMHKPEIFADNLTHSREDFAQVNKTLLPIHGFVQGKVAHGFRNDYPLFDKNHNHIGAIEVSFAIQTLQEQLTNVSKIHSHFLLDKYNFDLKTLEKSDLKLEYLPSAENDNFVTTMIKNDQNKEINNKESDLIKPLKNRIEAKMKKGDKFAEYLEKRDKNNNNEILTFAFYPIHNILSNEIIAWIVGYEENNQSIEFILKTSKIVQIFSFIFLFIMFYFLNRIINQKEILDKKVQEKTDILNALNQNLENKILDEVQKNSLIQEKLFRAEKLSAMGEMIANIAHQWRQPLCVISIGITGMKVEKEFGLLNDEKFNETCELINQNVQYLSKTIEDFNNFIKGTDTIEEFIIEKNIENFLNLISLDIKQQNISIILDIEKNISIKNYPNLLQQCFINIFNNSKDALIQTKDQERLFFISVKKENNKAIIQIKDNAGGIPQSILPKIFEPYFTTKHQSQGTGLGLNLTYNLVVDGMKGSIVARNDVYSYNSLNYTGAMFTIELAI